MNEQDKILKDSKKQLKHKNIIIAFFFFFILSMSILDGYFLINNKNKTPTTKRVYKDSDGAIVTNNKLDNDSQINIIQKEYK